jgi:para-nitrobenzyl esterase
MVANGGAVFKGVPYAQPPVGPLRWREPLPAKPWSGVRDATSFGAVCVQNSSVLLPDAGETSSEDCLFLNVWTPEWPSRSPKAVMVWIPGGGNFVGGSSPDVYDGERLATRGVVVVTLNYRLGAFGFLALPALSRESVHHASGNQGILDQVAALKWVRDNIRRFGGDQSKVTIFGESAGSLDASVLMTSPLAKGLFHRVIGESGTLILLGDPSPRPEAERRGLALVATWSVPDAPLEVLRAIPASEILRKEPNYLASPPPNLGITVDGYAVPLKPVDVFAAGREHRVPLMLGNNARERAPGTSVPVDLPAAIEQTYGPLSASAQVLYGAAPRDPVYGTAAEQWAADTSFRCSAVTQLAWHSAAGNRAFEFEFARTLPGREAQGTTHGIEMYYVFGTLDRAIRIAPQARPVALDTTVSDVMQRYWTTFAKTGDPNAPDLPTWPAFDARTRAYIQFTDAGPLAKEGLRRRYCDVFIENVRRHGQR